MRRTTLFNEIRNKAGRLPEALVNQALKSAGLDPADKENRGRVQVMRPPSGEWELHIDGKPYVAWKICKWDMERGVVSFELREIGGERDTFPLMMACENCRHAMKGADGTVFRCNRWKFQPTEDELFDGCPFHSWEKQIIDAECHYDPATDTTTWKRDGRVVVQVPATHEKGAGYRSSEMLGQTFEFLADETAQQIKQTFDATLRGNK